jgi:hypothetical protein
MREKNVVTSHRAMQQCSNISGGTSFEEDPSAGRATQTKEEASKATKRKTYRSTYHINLSPQTEHRNPEVFTSKKTVVLYIQTNQ